VLEGVDRALFALMAVETMHAGLTVRAVVPFPVETRVLRHMAIHALFTAWIAPIDPCLTSWTRGIGGRRDGKKPDGET
jgi:hypothetical protein